MTAAVTSATLDSSVANLTSNNKDYLAEYDAAPEAEKYRLVQKWMKTEPLPFFKQLREKRPILVTPECVLVSKFADVRDMLTMPAVFTVDLYKPKMGVTDTDPGYLMAHDDDALHYREKSLMQGMLNRDDLPRVRQMIANTASTILKNAEGKKIDIVNEYCRMVPAILVQDYFGLDGVDPKDLIRWSFWNQYDAFHNQPFDLNDDFQKIVDEHARVTEELVAYMAKLVARKLAMVKLEQTRNFLLIGWRIAKGIYNHVRGIKPPAEDDITTRMLRTSFAREVDFPLTRLGTNAGGLLIGSIETTSQAVAQVIQFILERPELLAQARQAMKDDEAFKGIVWEALRFVPISPYMFRQTSRECTLANGTEYETTIPARTNVLALTQSAMFDEYAFANPNEFNADRNWYHHFNYGFASHECLGKYVGMEMIPEMVRQVLLLPGLTSAGPIDYKNGPFPEYYELSWA